MIKIKRGKKIKAEMMQPINFIIILVLLSCFSTISFSEEKADCSKIKNDTLVGNLKNFLCKKGSDKLDKDGNFKNGASKIFKKENK